MRGEGAASWPGPSARDPGQFVGVSGLMTSEPPVGGPDPEFGCLLATRWHGQGFATEAGLAVLDDAWSRLGLDRVITVMDSPNLPSRRLVDKLGFRFEGAYFDDEAKGLPQLRAGSAVGAALSPASDAKMCR